MSKCDRKRGGVRCGGWRLVLRKSSGESAAALGTIRRGAERRIFPASGHTLLAPSLHALFPTLNVLPPGVTASLEHDHPASQLRRVLCGTIQELNLLCTLIGWIDTFPPIKDCSFNLNRLWTPTGDEGRVSANRDESSSQVIGRQIGPAKPLNAGGGRRTGVFVWSPWVCLRVCFPAEILRGHISKVVIRYAPMQGGCVQGLRARA